MAKKQARQRPVKKNEEPPEVLNNKLKHLIKNSFDIIGLVDGNGISHYVSESCEKILGYKQDELVGVPVIDLFVHPDDKELAREGMRSIIENSENGGMQYRHRHKKGGWVYLEAFGTNQINNPEIRAVVMNVRDITDRKNAEEALRKSERRLNELNTTKDRFFSIIGHDLKSPFNSIVGFSDILVHQIMNKDYHDLEKYARIIQNASRQAMDLLNDILEWSQSQSGTIQFKPEKVDLNFLINEVIGFFKSSIEHKGITITKQVPVGLSLFADMYMMNTILRNLISNGIKFTNPGDEIIISAQKEDNQIIVSVADNGIGMNKEDLDKLFRIDYSHSTPGTNQETGTGLGLLLCKEFVEMHSGIIRAESKPDKGSIFWFLIPYHN